MVVAPDRDILEHFGAKGMRWGVRKAKNTSSGSAPKPSGKEKRAARKEARIVKKDAKWLKTAGRTDVWNGIHNDAVDAHNADLGGINEKWSRVNVMSKGPNRDRYLKEVEGNFNKHIEATAVGYGLSPSGRSQLHTKYVGTDRFGMEQFELSSVDAVDVEHADKTPVYMIVEKDEKGFITKMSIPKLPKETIKQSSLRDDDILEHFGAKGMKWGTRKPGTGNPSKRTKGSGAKGKPKVDTSKMSHDELQKVVNRMKLDQQYAELSAPKKTKGKKYAQSILEGSGKTAAAAVVSTVVGIGIGKAFKSKG